MNRCSGTATADAKARRDFREAKAAGFYIPALAAAKGGAWLLKSGGRVTSKSGMETTVRDSNQSKARDAATTPNVIT